MIATIVERHHVFSENAVASLGKGCRGGRFTGSCRTQQCDCLVIDDNRARVQTHHTTQEHDKPHDWTKQVSSSIFKSQRLDPLGPDFRAGTIDYKLGLVGVAKTVVSAIEH